LFRDLNSRNFYVPVPPVTGTNNNSRPVANLYDDSSTFRDRTYSNKRRRRDGQDELLDAVFDLTNDFPPVAPPDRPAVDVASIKTVLVEATAMAENLKPLLGREDVSTDSKAIVSMLVTLVNLVGTVVEKGIEPISSVVVGVNATSSRSFAMAARKIANPPHLPAKNVPGKKELVEALKKSELESVLFGANLGGSGVAHRGTLNAAFSADLRKRTVEGADGQPGVVVDESLRVVEDALSCVDNVEFLGLRSQTYKVPGSGVESNFCSMPIRLSFPDKDSRLNFERTIRAAFRRALESRYDGDMIMARPDPRSLEFIAFRREGGVGKWLPLKESFPIPPEIMLSGYKVSEVTLPVVAGLAEGAEGGDGMAVG